MLLADPSDLSEEAFRKLRLAKREEADNAMAFASIIMKARYDSKHLNVNLKKGDEAFLRLHNGYSIPGLSNRKLSQQRVGPFKVLAKVGRLAYRLQLPPVMKIHPVISVAQLEPSTATVTGSDPYGRSINTEPPPVFNEGDEVGEGELERIKGRRPGRNEKPEYLVKWKDWGNEHNVWYSIDDLPKAMDLVHDYESKQALVPAARRRRGKGARTTQAPLQNTEATPLSQPSSQPQPPSQLPKRGRERPRKAS